MEKYDVIKDLSEGYSTQSETANRFWVLLIVASVVTFTGRPEKDSGLIELPFTLGKVDIIDFYSIMIILICVLSIAFSSAMIQAIRGRELIQKVINGMSNSELMVQGVHVQDIVDASLKPTFNRVAPLAQYLRGKNQFFGGKPSGKSKFWTGLFYAILKVTTFIFIYLIPAYSVCKGWSALNSATGKASFIFPQFLIIVLILLAIFSSIILFVGDIKYLARVFNKIRK